MSLYQQQIEQCRAILGPPPRGDAAYDVEDFELRISTAYKVLVTVHPLMIDTLLDAPKQFPVLRQQGDVVWGRLVFANNELWEAGNTSTLPALVLYSLDAAVDAAPELLEQAIAQIKAPTTPQLQELYDSLNQGIDRYGRWPLPFTLGKHVIFYLSSIWIAPHQLPSSPLKDRFLPLLAAPEETQNVMLLPAAYWPESVLETWFSGD